jgi:hypothetical protein
MVVAIASSASACILLGRFVLRRLPFWLCSKHSHKHARRAWLKIELLEIFIWTKCRQMSCQGYH